MTGSLKLAALDAQDLEVLSAHLQDAIVLVGDMKYDAERKILVMGLSRFDWPGADKTGVNKRREAALQFDHVLGVRTQNIRRDAKMAVLELLSMGFEETDPPSGTIDLVFAGGGTIRMDVECIEARLADLGPSWETPNMPSHDED